MGITRIYKDLPSTQNKVPMFWDKVHYVGYFGGPGSSALSRHHRSSNGNQSEVLRLDVVKQVVDASGLGDAVLRSFSTGDVGHATSLTNQGPNQPEPTLL